MQVNSELLYEPPFFLDETTKIVNFKMK